MRKFAYWLDRIQLEAVEAHVRQTRNAKVLPIKGVPCKGLSEAAEYSSTAPTEWDKTCRRQGGWYRASPRRGLYLMLSPEPLQMVAGSLVSVIEPCEFTPPRLADQDETAALAQSDAAAALPAGWHDITEDERSRYGRMLARIGSGADLDDVMESHTGNHANFVSPQFYVETGESPVRIPYSIGMTSGVCSACAELFGLVGEEFPVKYVMPCPGMVLFARLPADRYLRVSATDASCCG